MASFSRSIGGWLFRHRGWIPTPLVVVALVITRPLGIWTGLGIGIIIVGQIARIWAVSHIGPASRSRTVNAAKLTYTGPYELTRNPIYIANWFMFIGLSVSTGVGWLIGAFVCFFTIYYNLIVWFEESYLESRLGEIYRSYRNRVPRWLGEAAPVHAAAPRLSLDTRMETALRSERSTFVVCASVVVLILIRASTSG